MNKNLYSFKSVVVIFITITLFACEGNYQNVQKLNLKDGMPSSEGVGVNLFYTDSGRVVTNLMAPKLLDYSNLEFSYQEFPEGIEVHFFDKDKKSTVISDYAIRFNETGIVDLRENVVLTTADGNVLNAQQLYWDQNNKWVFTDQPYRITFSDGSFNDGARFDANEDFTVFLSRKNDGVQLIDQKQNDTPNGQ
ncbi:MAG TPA: LPS export ABC transporter periplasmic protein LptC [Flavobacteriaceae bacterium]|jgi:LPS export ABC transporter protein LptC|nr:LPS export ABC transporter periplasmic protein LptC [Flavobacteriaceae bacterium]HAT66384.1 LPS export ABC transporter periplasmic protein LptC [Flavobacteriaceae bacterium]|tara:strand:- start:189495 stop:190073 length:579 start_codon:yes stop_codon:yes gene_type:complete